MVKLGSAPVPVSVHLTWQSGLNHQTGWTCQDGLGKIARVLEQQTEDYGCHLEGIRELAKDFDENIDCHDQN